MSSRRGSAIARTLAVGFALSAVAALPARAQLGVAGPAAQQIPIGTSITGTLTMSDPTLRTDGSHYKLFTFMGTAGQTVQIDLMSSDFDAYLYLRDQNGNELAHDDDSGGGLNARILRQLAYTGMYQIVVNTARAGQFGAFTLQLQSSAMTQPVPTPIAANAAVAPIGTIGLNQQVQNNLVSGGPTYDGKPIQAYSFQCTAGQAFQMDILSDWDNYAIIFDPMNNVVATNDDGGEGLNARITYTCPQTATYRLGVTTYQATTATGLYTLRVQALGTPTPLGQPQAIGQPTPINPQPVPVVVEPTNPIPAPGATAQMAIGQTVRGRLETGDQTMADGTFADIWQFQGNAGQTVTIDVRSEEFDTYAQLLDATGTQKLAEDDDSGGNLNSRIVYTLPATGMYQIVVNNAGRSRRSGIYTVSIR